MIKATFKGAEDKGSRLMLQVEQLSQDIQRNESTVRLKLFVQTISATWKHRSKGNLSADNQVRWSITNSDVTALNLNANNFVVERTFTVAHANDGSKLLEVSAMIDPIENRDYLPTKLNVSGTVTLDTIPRRMQMTTRLNSVYSTTEQFTVECPQPPSGLGVAWELFYTKNNQLMKIGGYIQNRIANIRNHIDNKQSLANAFTDRKRISVTLRLNTYKDTMGNWLGYVDYPLLIELDDSFKPDITQFDIYEMIPVISNSNIGVFLREISRIGFTTDGNGKNGASIVERKVNGQTTPLYFLEPGDKQITLRIVDSRGMVNTQTKTIQIHDWKAPKINEFDVERTNQGSGTRVLAKVNYEYASINNITRTQYRIEARELPNGAFNTIYTSSWTKENVNVSNLLLPGDFNSAKSYEFKITALDDYSTRNSIDTISVAIVTGELGISGASFGMELTDINLVGIQTPNIVDENGDNYMLKAFPVGIVIEMTNDTDPNVLIGGRWREFGAGRVTVGLDVNQSEFNYLGKLGGSKSHTLTIDEMPRHNHWVSKGENNSSNMSYGANTAIAQNINKAHKGWWSETTSTGNTRPHNNLPPYVVVRKWQRIA